MQPTRRRVHRPSRITSKTFLPTLKQAAKSICMDEILTRRLGSLFKKKALNDDGQNSKQSGLSAMA
jgi:hypothetical protein